MQGRRLTSPTFSMPLIPAAAFRLGGLEADRMELDAVDERVLVDRPGVGGAVAQRLKVGFAGAPDVLIGDGRERDQLHGVDLDQPGADPVAAALLDLRTLPPPDRQR